MMNPVISIIIPCYNQGHYLEEALQSVDSNKDICEIIIINDGSTDPATIDILKQISGKDYNVIHQSNKGLGAARNAGIKGAKGSYILPLDCDNKIRPEYISEAIKAFGSDSQLEVVYGNGEYFGEKSGIWESGGFNLQRLMLENYIDACAVFRRSTWERLGGYDENMPVMGYEDWDLWLRIAFQNGKFQYIDKVMFDYRYSSNSMIRSVEKEKLSKIYEYLDKKHSRYLSRVFLNRFIEANAYNRKGLALSFAMRTYLPRISNLLRKAGLMHKRDLF